MTLSLIGQTATLVHGYTMADVDTMTRFAVARARRSAYLLDSSDSWDCAWHAIVEQLYASAEDPGRAVLVAEAARAINRAISDQLHHRGIAKNTGGLMPNAVKYWLPPVVGADDGFVEKLIERAALPQILGQLSAEQYEVVATVAVTGTHQGAADVLGLTVKQLRRRLKAAREQFVELWFEHETPPNRRPTAGRCAAGHSTTEHGYQTASGRTRCRLCMRNYSRASRAREGRAQLTGVA
ncbi:hypothetical protein [Nocardioides sp.]|uniref:hypothetical protein n=1 Tax=Nocardioides sp. TaxID=35761 RepID=UPI0026110A9D|nr:hypothetical protein [Nocardioides sp.]MDI6908632.1 hypothetical protein [Nocardioides sp.]